VHRDPPLGAALTQVPTRDLETLLARLHKGQLTTPITHQTLLVAGLPHLVDRLGFLSGLDVAAARAVLVAVIAERRAIERRDAARARAEERGEG
jgi:hypothetical protein